MPDLHQRSPDHRDIPTVAQVVSLTRGRTDGGQGTGRDDSRRLTSPRSGLRWWHRDRADVTAGLPGGFDLEVSSSMNELEPLDPSRLDVITTHEADSGGTTEAWTSSFPSRDLAKTTRLYTRAMCVCRAGQPLTSPPAVALRDDTRKRVSAKILRREFSHG